MLQFVKHFRAADMICTHVTSKLLQELHRASQGHVVPCLEATCLTTTMYHNKTLPGPEHKAKTTQVFMK